MTDFLHQALDDRGVLHLTLNRPEKSNAFDDELIRELIIELKEAAETPEVRMIQLQGSGRHFCAGADVCYMQRMVHFDYGENVTDARQLAELMNTLYRMPQPTLAVVQGAAYGGGAGLVACCDMVIASDHAQFCFSEVRIGLVPANMSPYVIRAIGERQARRYFLSAEIIDAHQALQIGLVHKVVPDLQLAGAARNWADGLLANVQSAVLAAKDLIVSIGDHPINDSLMDETSDRIARIRVSESGQAGMKAFINKRKKR